MPIYEYECENCDLRFELRRRFSDNGGGFCPRCGNEAQRRFAQVPIIFKGSGFYVTDSRKNSGQAEGKSTEKSASGHQEN